MESNKPTLHYMQNSASQQSLWLLEELGIEYDLVLHTREGGRAAPALKNTHPLGKAPQLVTGSGRVIAERSAIAYYLIETYDHAGRFKVPASGSPGHDSVNNDKIREEQLLSVGQTTLNQFFSIKSIFGGFAYATPFFVRPLILGLKLALEKAFIDGEIDNALKFLDSELEGRQYFNGTTELTRIDFILQWYVDFGVRGGSDVDISKYPNLKGWYERCMSRDAWKRALEKGNGYDLTFWKK
ncbi:uncharacterized protein GGS22DRAFT_185771 [Annulohypoxylon maeteangense]|uniref:uncharacterized protein n=1 Tax=Annulohypoxylon maeteangense TaxID=1927788 RepID=UPI0020078887|nr:uncharacterized protein GGS22DRAFT_185771 [Annulohypoxylon maeteangense]KAI0888394.1 hypothetical protein GGS22DRAFT_185771 [Annulohypoxylon maeteangense]